MAGLAAECRRLVDQSQALNRRWVGVTRRADRAAERGRVARLRATRLVDRHRRDYRWTI